MRFVSRAVRLGGQPACKAIIGLLAVMSVPPACASEMILGETAPTGRIIPEQDVSRLNAGNASTITITSNRPSTDIRMTTYRKADRSDAVIMRCATPCQLLVPKRYGFILTTEVPERQRLTSAPVTFAWSEPAWCRGGLLCKTRLEPAELAVTIDAIQ